MKILIAPDSFKGSLTANQVAEAMREGIHSVSPETEVVIVPLADGGEGTVNSLMESTNGYFRNLEVYNPIGNKVNAQYGITGDSKTAVIELASASGLQTLPKNELDPAKASTFGSGQLILDALEIGIRSFIICLGGSATNDGGTGILRALGFRFLDSLGKELEPGGLALNRLHTIDESNVDERVRNSRFQVACDVDSPLIGPKGASFIFGPQKGALPEMAQKLDVSLSNFAERVYLHNGRRVHNLPGGGAAGGTSAGLYALLNAELAPGFEIVKKSLKLNMLFEKERFDLVLTGEGRIDHQTASGKVISSLASLAKIYNVETIAIAGAVEDGLEVLHERGLTAAFSILDGPKSLEQAIENSFFLIKKQSEQIYRLLKVRKNLLTNSSN
ncbi:glycerate kinase [Bacillus sp. 1P02SD]|uniref:glycerate kinase n=1 Tax=Bacillus sp. 1P02SD TaxID=3132264 RepID=UPI00399F722A